MRHHKASLSNEILQTARKMRQVIVETQRQKEQAAREPANIIAFRCAGCGQMFYAAHEDAVDFETAQEIAGYLLAGHRLEKVTASTARRELVGCNCRNLLPAA
mgnify:CR=1 FL=1